MRQLMLKSAITASTTANKLLMDSKNKFSSQGYDENDNNVNDRDDEYYCATSHDTNNEAINGPTLTNPHDA